MKYTELLQIKDYFLQFKKIDFIRRIDDNILELSLDKNKFIFNLNKGFSSIFKAKIINKHYNAPFDFMLKKYFFNAKIENIEVLKDNRVLVFSAFLEKSYKSFKNKIYFEFTGKNTNAIITDENNIVLESLRHIEKSYRIVKVGQKLQDLKPYKMDNDFIKIEDFDTYFKEKFEQNYQKNLIQYKNNKISQINKKISLLDEYLNSLENEDDLIKDAKDYALKADVLFANLYNIKDYERKFHLFDFNDNKIYFNLEQSPKQSANLFYKISKKLKQKAKNINIQRLNLIEKIDFFKNLLVLIEKAKSINELDILLPKKSKNSKKEELNIGIANFYFNEFKISVGKNEKANEYLLKNAKKDDIWMHVKDYPSAHVLIISNKLNINEEILQFSARLCVNFSNLNKGLYLVDYTSKKFVKIIEKAFVNYTNYKSISVLKD